MIGQIDIEKSLLNAPNDRSLFVAVASVVNSLVDAVNGILSVQEEYRQAYAEDIIPMLTPQNEESDYITTTYTTDGKQKKYYGQNGAWVETDFPIPAGYVITIREPETKGGDNE